jgi:hypothetical protein
MRGGGGMKMKEKDGREAWEGRESKEGKGGSIRLD